MGAMAESLVLQGVTPGPVPELGASVFLDVVMPGRIPIGSPARILGEGRLGEKARLVLPSLGAVEPADRYVLPSARGPRAEPQGRAGARLLAAGLFGPSKKGEGN